MSSQGSHENATNTVLAGEHDVLDNDLEDDLAKPERYSILSGYLRAAARHAKDAPLDVLCALLPSFVLSLLRPSAPSSSSSRTHCTSALDGIRGWACVAVMNYHVLWVYQPLVHYGYGLSREDLATCIQKPNIAMQNGSFLQLPIIRLLYSGTAPVSVFFIISGFVLAYKPLALSRQGRSLEVFVALASSIFRRGIRLYLPVFMASFFSFVTFRFGWWQYRDILTSWDQVSITRISEPMITRQPTLLLQIRDWLQDLSMLINAWDWNEYYPRYDAHLWTVSSEFRASMVLFLTLAICVVMRRPLQIVPILLIIFYTYAYDRWEVALFLAGLLLADISQARQLRFEARGEALHQSISMNARASSGAIWRVVLIDILQGFLLTLALYTLSTPDFCLDRTPGYRILSRLIPHHDTSPHRFYPSIGAFLIVFLVSQDPPARLLNLLNSYMLNSSVAQYFGRISYSLYLVHGPLLHIVGYRLFSRAWSYTGRDGLLAYCVGFGIAYGIFFALVVWIADIFWKVVDMRSVRLARSLERHIMISIAETTSI